MVFFAQKVLRRMRRQLDVRDRDRPHGARRPDRHDVQGRRARSRTHESKSCHAGSGAHLRELLTRQSPLRLHADPQVPDAGECSATAATSSCITDEAHRSQYDTLALNMRAALPNALFIAFTGTPLIAGEERTREVFGDYVSIYDFQQSVEDDATVRLFYENRTPELQLENPNLNDDIYALIEAAELDEDQEKRLERELGRQYHLITRDDRLETIAKDIVQHFLGRGFQGKAMVVSIDKATALRMHDKVRKHWQAERARVETELARLHDVRDEARPGARARAASSGSTS